MKNKFKLVAVVTTSLFLAACATTSTTTGSNDGYKFGGIYTESVLLANNTVYFATNSYDIDTRSQQVVNAYAEYIKQKNQSVVIEGYTDERGTPEYNIALGLKRAQAVRDSLISLGINASLINIVSYGESRPSVLGSTSAAYDKNRRAVFNIRVR